jgi:hypothetical protein
MAQNELLTLDIHLCDDVSEALDRDLVLLLPLTAQEIRGLMRNLKRGT